MPVRRKSPLLAADIELSGVYAHVIVDRTVAELARPLTYAIPAEQLSRTAVGSLVLVPLRHSEALGYVIGLQPELSIEEQSYRIRPVKAVLSSEPLWGPDLMGLAQWMQDFYHAFLSQCLQSVVPAPVRMENRRRKPQSRTELERLEAIRPAPELTPTQQHAVEQIRQQLSTGRAAVSLLHGVTGSGKTEVYLHAIQSALDLGRQAIVLVPEISLTAQAIDRYTARFGERVAVMHSALSAAERLGEWWRLRRGEAQIALGARSAVFAPLSRLGLVIVDEEQDTSYKQDNPPRYHARQVAIKRAKDSGAVVVLGSATPSLESFYWAQQRRYRYIALPERIARLGMPRVDVLDMKSPRAGKRFGVFSQHLKERIEQVLQDEQSQVLLFLNRRGFSSFLLCEKCGYMPPCGNCAVTLTYHLQGRLLKCHYCLHEEPLPPACPKCGHEPFKHQGSGTQRVEEDLARFFPGVPVVRMDRDSTTRKGAHRTLLGEFASGRARILLGTQMIAKGLDFPQVRLVAVLSADTALGLPDFRAAERAFSLLTQVAGRAGRSEWGGEVILQTYNPDHPAIVLASRHDYQGFYDWDIANRQAMRYPPFSHFVKVTFSGEEESAVLQTAHALAADVRERATAAGMDLMGPAPCPISRVRNRYRWQLLVRGPQVQDIVAVLRRHVDVRDTPSCQVSLDVDPVSML